MNTMSYKDYVARIEYSDEDGCFVGHIAGIRDIVGFHGDSVSALRTAFEEAVDDYIETCERLNRQPQRAYSGEADEQLKQKIHDVLKTGYFQDPDDLVDVSDGADDSIHVVIVSRKFDGRPMKEKHDLIWSELSRELDPEEWGKVSLSIGVSPEEIKAT